MNLNILIVVTVVLIVFAIAIYYSWNKQPSDKSLSKDIKAKMKTIPGYDTEDIHRLKSILVDYDKLVDYYLKAKKFPGNTMGERLKSAKENFSYDDYNKIWMAHKVRNMLVHEFSTDLKPSLIRKEIANLRAILEKVK